MRRTTQRMGNKKPRPLSGFFPSDYETKNLN